MPTPSAQTLGSFPIGNVTTTNFAIRFSGEFNAQTAGAYTFYVAATDGAQLKVDGTSRPAFASETLDRGGYRLATDPGLASD